MKTFAEFMAENSAEPREIAYRNYPERKRVADRRARQLSSSRARQEEPNQKKDGEDDE